MYNERPIDDFKESLELELIDYNDYNNRISLKSKDLMDALNKSKYYYISVGENGNGLEAKIEDEDDNVVFQNYYSPQLDSNYIIKDLYTFLLQNELNILNNSSVAEG